MQLTTLAVVAAATVQAGIPLNWGGSSSIAVSWPSDWSGSWNCAIPFWRLTNSQCRSKGLKYPTPPSGCPAGYPKATTPWDYTKFKFPGPCKSHPRDSGAYYPPGCTKNTNKPKPVTTSSATSTSTTSAGAATTSSSTTSTSVATVPTPVIVPVTNMNFTLACPTVPAGQIFDGQIQCNSPYPASDVANGATTAIVTSSFYLLNGGLYDQYGRGCEISSGNQLQCNALTNGATAEAGFAIDSSSNLIWQGENTWYGCNIGTDSSYGQIIYTGTHLDFSGTSSPTSDNNPNCIALRLGVTWIN